MNRHPASTADERIASPALLALYGVSTLAGAGAGLFGPLTTALLDGRGASATSIGAMQSLFFGWMMLAAPLARAAMRRRGARWTIAAGLLLSAASAMAMPMLDGLPAWFASRAAMGIGLGLYMIGGQGSLGVLSPDAKRGTTSALQGFAFGIGLGLGPLAGTALYGVSPMLAFGAGSTLLLLGVPLVLWLLPRLRFDAPPPRYALLKSLGISLHAVFAYGVAEASLLTIFPLFLLQHGTPLGSVGVAFAAFVCGGLISALPLGHLADRVGRESVLLGCALVGAASAMGLVFVHDATWLNLLSLATGASLGPVYAIALALVGQKLGRDDMAAGSAVFTMAFSAGSMAAPWLSSMLMTRFGAEQVFTLTAVLFGSLALRLIVIGSPRASSSAPAEVRS